MATREELLARYIQQQVARIAPLVRAGVPDGAVLPADKFRAVLAAQVAAREIIPELAEAIDAELIQEAL